MSRERRPQFTRQELSADDAAPPKRRVSERDRARRRMDEKRVGEQLTEIYDGGDRGARHMRIDPPPRRRLVRAIATLLLSCAFFGAAAWVGFFVLQPKQAFSEDRVSLSITGPDEARAGDRVTYRFRYANHDRVALRGVTLDARYPEGFVPDETIPSARAGWSDAWDIADIAGSGVGEVVVSGRITGDLGSAQSFRVFFNYTPVNFHAEFQKVATHRVRIGSSPFALAIDAPRDIARGGSAGITLRLTGTSSTGDMPIDVTVTAPVGFTKISAKPSDDSKTPLTWRFSGLPAGDTAIVLRGTFAPPPDASSADIGVVVRGWLLPPVGGAGKRIGDGFILAQATTTIAFVSTDVAVSLALNGSVGEATVAPGETLSATLRIKNTGSTPISGVALRAVFDAPAVGKNSILKWSELEDPLNGPVVGEQVSDAVRRGTIIWTAAQMPALKVIPPGGEATVDFHLPIKGADDADLAGFDGVSIQAKAEAEYAAAGEKKTIASAPVLLTLMSDTTIDVRDTASLLGNREKHLMSWVVQNSAHDLADIRVEGELYGDIVWDALALSVPAGSVSFDEKTKRVVWTIDQMPTTIDVLALQFGFSIARNPTQTELASKVALKATDRAAGADLHRVGDGVSLAQ